MNISLQDPKKEEQLQKFMSRLWVDPEISKMINETCEQIEQDIFLDLVFNEVCQKQGWDGVEFDHC